VADLAGPMPAEGAIRAPWSEDPALRASVRRLRDQGHTVVCTMPGDAPAAAGARPNFEIDRELVCVSGQWVLQAAAAA
jgi:ATP phosphoribosyltransferase regulatory subunit